MLRNHSGLQLYPLKSGSGTVANLTQGTAAQFDLGAVPISQGNKANYLLGLAVTIKGSLTQSGGTGSVIPWDTFVRALVESFGLQNCWHGRPIASEVWKGSRLPIIEYIGNGGRYGERVRGRIPAANGSYTFNRTIFLPLGVGYGRKPHHTAQLALFYRGGEFVINTAAASALTTLSTGASLSSLTCQVSAVLLPEPELRLGPGNEFVSYEEAVASGQNTFALKSFGNKSSLIGTEKGAGMVFHGMLTSWADGAFAGQNLTQIAVPYRDQVSTAHVESLISAYLNSLGPSRPIGGIADQGAALSDASGFPYSLGNDPSSGSVGMGANLMFFPVGPAPTQDLELSKIQTVDGEEEVQATISGLSGTMRHLCQHVRSWTPEKIEDAARAIVDSGLAQKVLGTSSVDWDLKLLNKQDPDTVNPRKGRYMPLVLRPTA